MDIMLPRVITDPIELRYAGLLIDVSFILIFALVLYRLLTRQFNAWVASGVTEIFSRVDAAHSQSIATEIINGSTDAIYAKDLQGRYLLFNQAFSDTSDKLAVELLEGDVSLLFPQPQAEMVRTQDQLVLSTQRVLTFEQNLSTAAGERTYLSTKGPLHDANGQLIGIFGISRDITDRKLEAQALTENEFSLQEAQSIAGLGSYVLDIKTGMWSSSKMLDELLGIDQEFEHSVDGWKNLIHPLDRDSMYLYFTQDILNLGKSFDKEYRILRQNDQALRWVHGLGRLEVDAQGQPVKLRGTIQDITQRKYTEQQLHKLVQAVEQSSEGIIITNLHFEIEYVNQAYLNNCGYSLTELIGQNPRILNSGKTPKSTYKAFWEAMQQGRSWKGEFINKRKDGSEYVAFSLITPLRQSDGTVSHFVSVQEDITEKKRNAQELDQYRYRLEALVESRTAELQTAIAHAQAANHAKTVFLANMSHEIRTPLNAIIGLTHLLKQTDLSEDQCKRLEKIAASGQHLLSIINDILDLSKIEAGHLQLEQRDFALESVLDNVCSLFTVQAKAKGLTIEVESNCVPTWLRGDQTRVRQIMLNFVSNAIKFTEHGGICLRAKLMEETEQGIGIRFEVQDSGIGISADFLPHLFDAFTQEDITTARMFGGTGLGLAITRRVAKLMGGEVGVESTPGVGSTFWFTVLLQRGHGLKCVPENTASVAAETTLREQYAGTRILVVDDNPINLEVAQALLHAVSLNVDTAENGAIAVQKIFNQHYALVLMDVHMPEMDGLLATSKVRNNPLFAQLPILAMTANAFDEDRARCMAVGMNDFVTKPVNPDSFYHVLLRWLTPVKSDVNQRAFKQQPLLAKAVSALNNTSSPNAVPEKWLHLSGLNIQKGLAVVNGDVQKYKRLLNLFVSGHSDDMLQVFTAIRSGDRLTAKRISHALKGVAGTLAITQVYNTAVVLDKGLLQELSDSECITLAMDCEQQLQEIVQIISESKS